jgi:hypothetical protein
VLWLAVLNLKDRSKIWLEKKKIVLNYIIHIAGHFSHVFTATAVVRKTSFTCLYRLASYLDLRRYAITPIPVTRAAPAATPLYAAAQASRLVLTAVLPPEAIPFLRPVVPE